MESAEEAKNVSTLIKPRSEISRGLNVVKRFTQALHKEDIHYCHWKSNEHLHAAMSGKTDLDILVEKGRAQTLSRILSETDFKHFSPVPWLVYPGITDYLAIDDETGRLVHLHLHHELTLGEKHLKGYRLPWEQLVFSTRLFDAQEEVYVTDPNVEMLLLLVRAALRIRMRDRLLAYLGTNYFRGDLFREFLWLKERTQSDHVSELTKSQLGDKAAAQILTMMNGNPSISELLTFRKSAGCTLNLFKTYGAIKGTLHRWFREVLWLRGALYKRLRLSRKPFRRTSSRGGLMIALVGSDGAGKSTLAKGISEWLSWKVDVLRIYFGSGDGPSSLLRLPLLVVLKLLRKTRVIQSTGHSTAAAEEWNHASGRQIGQRLKAVARVPWALLLAYEKRKKLRRAWRARGLGMVVICDRYPQCQVMGFNDGPLLSRWLDHQNRLLRHVAHWELIPYQRAESYPPDLVIKLDITPELAVKRTRFETPIEEIRSKAETIKNLRYPPETKVVSISTLDVMDRVLLEAKRTIWENI